MPAWVYTRSSVTQLQKIEVPPAAASLDIELSIPDALSPRLAGQSEDGRELGVGVTSVCLAKSGTSCLSK
jgi:hypothetical protein